MLKIPKVIMHVHHTLLCGTAIIAKVRNIFANNDFETARVDKTVFRFSINRLYCKCIVIKPKEKEKHTRFKT